jgi:hypothetical protein
MLARWAIPEGLMAGAPEPPYFFDSNVFIDAADAAVARDTDTPSDMTARQALPPGGTVLDVGVGAGAASLRLDAGHLVGVDTSRELLEAFRDRAAGRGIRTTLIEGRWPDVESRAPAADVVLCHHVLFNVPDLADFAAALVAHARARVVVELTTAHPMAWMIPYWMALHNLARPDRPTVDDAIEVLSQLGHAVHQQRWVRQIQMIGEDDVDRVARIARRLCLPAARHDELRRLLAVTPPPREREVATLWWDPLPRTTLAVPARADIC